MVVFIRVCQVIGVGKVVEGVGKVVEGVGKVVETTASLSKVMQVGSQ